MKNELTPMVFPTVRAIVDLLTLRGEDDLPVKKFFYSKGDAGEGFSLEFIQAMGDRGTEKFSIFTKNLNPHTAERKIYNIESLIKNKDKFILKTTESFANYKSEFEVSLKRSEENGIYYFHLLLLPTDDLTYEIPFIAELKPAH